MSFAESKKVLAVVSHQDDESLFCGGLLTVLRGASRTTVICMSEAKHKRDAANRDRCFREACNIVEARAVTTTFREARHVWSSADLFFRKRPDQIAAMTEFLEEQSEAIRPDIVITHNEAGEYGHCYHKVVHRVCRRVFPAEKIYCIARGSKLKNRDVFEINYDPEKKKQLLACYPNFDAHGFSLRFFGRDMVYLPETYFALGTKETKPAEASRPKIYFDVSSDFLHFWNRKLRAKVKWY